MIQQNFSLKNYNTFGIDILARYFATFNSVDNLKELLNNNYSSKLILGGGSNILFTKNFDGIVLKNDIKGISILQEDENYVYIKAAAGENWNQFVRFCVNNNYAGLENLSLIPGNVGTSPIQNIGAYGVEIKDVFYALEAYHFEEKKMVTFNLKDCVFGYRESVFKKKYKNEFVIINVTFKLNKHPKFNTTYGAINQELEKMGVYDLSIKTVAEAVTKIRLAKLPNPAEIGNAGSFFKNPEIALAHFNLLKKMDPQIVGYFIGKEKVKIAAGWLIESCGWKGFREGDAGCHKLQALVLINYGNATGNQIVDLSFKIIHSVKQKFDIKLETEVNIM